MKIRVLAGAAALTLALGACGHGKAANVASNKNVNADTQAAQQIVSACMTKGDVLTHDGRQTILNCIAPKGHEQAFQACAATDLSHSNLFTKDGRAGFEQGLAVCAEKNR